MRCRSEKIATKPAFSLVEVLTALAILALISSSVLVVINRCMASAANSTWKMQAFEVARENMEKLLCSDSVTETVEYGSSDKYPDIQWQSTVESFYEPITMRMWIQAVCSAQYADTDGQPQTVELTHWLTDLTKEDMIKILEQQQEEEQRLAEEAESEQDERDEQDAQEEQTSQEEQTEQDKQREKDEQSEKSEKDTTEPREPETERGSEDVIWINGQPYSRQELGQMSFSELWQLFMGGG